MRRFRYTTSGLFGVMLVACIVLAAIANRIHRQHRAEEAIRDLGGRVVYESERKQLNSLLGLPHKSSWFNCVDDVVFVALRNTRTSDADLTLLFEFPELREVDLGGTKVTNKGIATLAKLGKLENINLRDLPLTDDAIADLAKLTNLSQCIVTGTQMSPAGKARLKHERSDLVTDDTPFVGGSILLSSPKPDVSE